MLVLYILHQIKKFPPIPSLVNFLKSRMDDVFSQTIFSVSINMSTLIFLVFDNMAITWTF